MRVIKLFPSLIAADLLHLADAIAIMEPHCDGFHIDIMDNHFVPNLTWGYAFIEAIAKVTKKPMHLHLMIDKPLDFIKKISLPQHTVVSFHIESEINFSHLYKIAKEKKLVPSVAIKQETPLSEIFTVIEYFDHVLLMSVTTGFSGQQFLSSALERLKELMLFKQDSNLLFTIAMDGGINETNIKLCFDLGATEFAVAQGIYGKTNPVTAIEQLYTCAQNGRNEPIN
jgi:ribulose-phosphate 3-epimerase